jgi:uncharacterized protein (TIGR02996 family)
MTDLEALHQAVLDHPDDDTPRLIYADALEDAGDSERAAFIRAHVAAERGAAWEAPAIRFRLHELAELGDWPTETLPQLPDGLEWLEQPFRRGFPAAIDAGDGSAFIRPCDSLFSIAPVEELHLAAIPLPNLDGLIACAGLSRIRKLVLSEGAIGMTAERLLASPHLGGLNEFHLGSQMSTGATEAAVVRSPAFARLRAFGCRNVRWPERLLTEMLQLRRPPRLAKLDLARSGLALNPFDAAFSDKRALFEELFAADIVKEVEALDLSENHLGPAGVESLAEARLPRLRSLALRQVRPEERGLRALLSSDRIAELRSLSLAGNNLGPRAAELIVHADRLESLRVLDLSENRLGDAGARLLAAARSLDGLLLLDVSENGISEAGESLLRERFAGRVIA